MTISRDQAQALAGIAHDCRPHGAPQWDHAGIMAALGKLNHLALADVGLALIRAADDRNAKTPAVITNTTSPHWRERGTDRPEAHVRRAAGHFCLTCGDPLDAHRSDDHAPERPRPRPELGDQVERLRAARAEATTGHCRHGVRLAKCTDCTKAHAHADTEETA